MKRPRILHCRHNMIAAFEHVALARKKNFPGGEFLLFEHDGLIRNETY